MYILRSVVIRVTCGLGRLSSCIHRLECPRVLPATGTVMKLHTTSTFYKQYTSTYQYFSPTFCTQHKPESNFWNTTKRCYAKGKNKGRNKGDKAGHTAMKLSQEELESVLDWQHLEEHINTELDHLKAEYIEKLTLSTSIGAFNNLLVDTTDGKLPLIQLSHVSQKGQQTVVVDMSMSPQYIPATKTALTQSLGLNPQQDGTTLFVNLPKVTKEHRENLAKTAKVMCNNSKTRLRDIQTKALQKVNKIKSEHSEDLIYSVQISIQKLVKVHMDKADELLTQKTNELLRAK